jgi:hypothetical protein
LKPRDTVHKIDQSSEQTSKSPSRGRCRKEERNAKVDLVSAVPLSEEEGDTGKETGFSHTEEETSGEKACKIADTVSVTRKGNCNILFDSLDKTHTRHDDTPSNHNGGEPHGRSEGGQWHVEGCEQRKNLLTSKPS